MNETRVPFPPDGLPVDPKALESAEALSDALKRLASTGVLLENVWIRVAAADGVWSLLPRSSVSAAAFADMSAHERLEVEDVFRQAEGALLALAAFLDPEPCGAIGLEFAADVREARKSILRVLASAWRNARAGSVSIPALPRTLPVARDFLSSLGGRPFLPPPRGMEDILTVSVEERRFENPQEPTRHPTLSFTVECGRTDEPTAVRNILLHAMLLGAIRDGVVFAGDFDAWGFHLRAADSVNSDGSAHRALIEKAAAEIQDNVVLRASLPSQAVESREVGISRLPETETSRRPESPQRFSSQGDGM